MLLQSVYALLPYCVQKILFCVSVLFCDALSIALIIFLPPSLAMISEPWGKECVIDILLRADHFVVSYSLRFDQL